MLTKIFTFELVSKNIPWTAQIIHKCILWIEPHYFKWYQSKDILHCILLSYPCTCIHIEVVIFRNFIWQLRLQALAALHINIYFRAMCVVLLLHDGEAISVLDVCLFMNLSWGVLFMQTHPLLFSFCSLITYGSLLPKYLISLKLLVILSWHMQIYWGKYTECLECPC